MEYNEKEVKGLEESIKHHEENVTKLCTLIGEFSTEHQFYKIRGEIISFSASDCPLCREFNQQPPSMRCPLCPLSKAGHNCNSDGSVWHKLQNADSKEEAIEAEESMVEMMKGVLSKYTVSKFKVGDTVKYIKESESYVALKVGVVTTVTRVGFTAFKGNLPCVEVESSSQIIPVDCLEKVYIGKFKVGDTVRVVDCPGVKWWYKGEEAIGWEAVLTFYQAEKLNQGKVTPLGNNTHGINFTREMLVKIKEDPMAEYKEMEEKIAQVNVWDEKMDSIIEELERRPNGTRRGIAVLVNDYDGFIGIDRFRTPTGWFEGEGGVNHEGSYIKFGYSSKEEKPIALRALLTWLLERSDIKKDIIGTEQRVDIAGKSYRAKILKEDI